MDVLRAVVPRSHHVNGFMQDGNPPPTTSHIRKLISDMTMRFEQTNLDDADFQQLQTEFLEFTEYMPSDMDRCEKVIEEFEERARVAESEYDRIVANLMGDNAVADSTAVTPPQPEMDEYLAARQKWLRCLGVCETERTRVLRNNKAWLARLAIIGDKLRDIRETLPSDDVLASSSPAPVSSTRKKQIREESPSVQYDHVAEKKAEMRRNGFWQNVGRSNAGRRMRQVIVVPGDILPPGFLDANQYSDDDSSDDANDDGHRPPPAKTTGRIKVILKTSEPQKIRIPKLAKQREIDRSINTHKTASGPSMTSIIASLAPPPVDAQPGSRDAPWLQLTQYELARLRKRMKKNSQWTPSGTMLNRELAEHGRGLTAYRAAKARAKAAGQPFGDFHTTVPRAIDEEPAPQGEESVNSPATVNKGMKLNDLKKEKLKREAQQKEAAMAAEEMSGGLKTMLSRGLSNSFLSQPSNQAASQNGTANQSRMSETANTSTMTPGKVTTQTNGRPEKRISLVNNKRKRESTTDTTNADIADTPGPSTKKHKVETPIPAPRTAGLRSHNPLLTPSISDTNNINPTPAAAPLASSRKSSTPILPPGKDKKDKGAVIHDSIDVAPVNTGRSTRAQSTKISSTPTPASTPPPTTALGKTSARRTASRLKSETVEQQSTPNGRPSRLGSHAPPTPVPEASAARAAPRRATKRQPPGTVTIAPDTTETVKTSRPNATRKKVGPKKAALKHEEEQVQMVEVDDQGNEIDPNEERFCLCNRVSFGVMVACENQECEKEWFHLECVGLEKEPGRTKLWFCPTCRVVKGFGETTNGEVSASVVARAKSKKA